MDARPDSDGASDIEPEAYGRGTVELLESALDSGADRVCLLMRHSAREFAPDVHDLVNPLTDEGREFSQRLGRWLPKSGHVGG